MRLRLPSRRAFGIAAATVLAICLVAWLAVPAIVQSQAQAFIAEKTGHRLTMDKPDFNPFILALTLHNVSLQEPDGKPLLAFRELVVNVSATSLVRAAVVFDAIRLDGLRATVAELPGDRLNWTALFDALKGKNEPPPKPTGLPRIDINLLSISDGQVDVADRRTSPERAISVDPIDIELDNLSTLPNDEGRYEISARTGFAERIEWRGELTLNPLAVSGQLSIGGIALHKVAGLLKLPPGLATPVGTASLATHYQVVRAESGIDVRLDQLTAKVAGLNLRGRDSTEPVLALDLIEASAGRFDLRQRRIEVGSLALTGGSLAVVRAGSGRLNLQDLLQSPPTEPAAKAGASGDPAAPPWHYHVGRIALTKFRAGFRDQGVSPAAELAMEDIDIRVDGVSDNLKAAWPLRASLRARDGGELMVEGTVVAGEPLADLRVKLSELALKPVQPYLGAATTLKIGSGRLGGEGRLLHNAKGTQYQGSFALRNLALTEGEYDNALLRWNSLSTRKLAVSTSRLAIADLLLDGLDTRLFIDADKATNLGRIMRKPSSEPAAPDAKTAPPAKPYGVAIERLRITNGQLEFADNSLAMPFGTRINNLHGSLDGLGTLRSTPGRIELDGEVDDYGLARAIGAIDLFKPTDFMDIKVSFRNVEMTRLTPYAATFAGRRIESGKLSLDLEYKINKRQLAGDNTVLIDTLVLGERVESPQAKDLPLDLAIAILQDSDGRIDLGLPVSGNLDDPEFSYGQIVWKAFINVIGKIVSAPFRALGSLFGSEEGMDGIVFEAGQARLTAPEREKLTKLAGALHKRPKLALVIHGAYAEIDRQALQDLQLRRALAARLDRPVDDESDPGPMASDDPKVQAALEDLFGERFGGAELAALREGFRLANPDRASEIGKDRMTARLAGLFRDKRTLSEGELAQLKDADLHKVLYARLSAQEAVTDERLRALAKSRGEAALAVLNAAAAPAGRVTLLDSERIEVEGAEVPLKMDAKVAP
ncbi:MAG: DUF748 domain-containing protein [Rhodocyclales bacterium]|nr:DUF748 domain-containing protein [Rhodocyclales bacterium]